MKQIFALVLMAACASSCATLNDSLQLGAGTGMAVGFSGVYGGHAGTGKSPSFERVAIGSGIGMGLGLLASYIIHKDIQEKRDSGDSFRTEMHFGDLPPSPFVIPQSPSKKGGR